MENLKDRYEDAYQTARKVLVGALSLSSAIEHMVHAHGMNASSAQMQIRSLCHLISGETYRRALTVDETDYFLQRIEQDDGAPGLDRALHGLSAHIDYRHSTGVNVPGLQTVLDKHKRRPVHDRAR